MKPIKIFSAIGVVVALAVGVSAANADYRYGYKKFKRAIIKAEVATGPNKYLDGPIRDHGVVFGVPMGTLGFAEVGEYNPGGTEALPLTQSTPDSAVLATFLDPNFVTAIGFDPNDLDPKFLNVPLQDVRTLSEFQGDNGLPAVDRLELPSMFDSEPFQASIAAPSKPITLGDWKKAKGVASIRCRGDNYSKVVLRMRKLVPNRQYTVWSANAGAFRGPFNQPFAGAPSSFTSDEWGSARFARELNFCPLNADEERQAQMLWLMVVLHTDHIAYGGVFAPNADSLFGGTVAHVHLHFPIQGTRVN